MPDRSSSSPTTLAAVSCTAAATASADGNLTTAATTIHVETAAIDAIDDLDDLSELEF